MFMNPKGNHHLDDQGARERTNFLLDVTHKRKVHGACARSSKLQLSSRVPLTKPMKQQLTICGRVHINSY